MTCIEKCFNLCGKRRAILNNYGHMLILGGPGSGKTTIALLKAHRIVTRGLPNTQSVLFLSFSNAAIRRINESAVDILQGEVGEKIEIKTYHSFAWDILRSHGYLLSQQRILKIVPSHDADVRRAGLDDTAWGREEERLFVEDGLVTFDQFAPKTAELFAQCPQLLCLYANAYPHILVDEFQDTDGAQWNIIKALSAKCDIIALGDPNQRIYDFRPGVSPKRMDEFCNQLNPQVYDFANENNRSPETGIANFGRALLQPRKRLPRYSEVKIVRFPPGRFSLFIKLATQNILTKTRRRVGCTGVNIALAARTKVLVRLMSDYLHDEHILNGVRHGPIAHDVLIDQSQVFLSARVTAFLLETNVLNIDQAIIRILELLADIHRAVGNKTRLLKANQYQRWADGIRNGTPKITKLVKSVRELVESLRQDTWSGSPRCDWICIRKQLENSNAEDLRQVAGNVRFLRILRKGSAIEQSLIELWRTQDNYTGATQAVETAILRDQILDSVRPTAMVTLMTMHQLKGREYDGVIVAENEYYPFVYQKEKAPYMDSRRLLQVSITRARMFAFLVTPKNSSSLEKLNGPAR